MSDSSDLRPDGTHRVVVTGVGIVSPIGIGWQQAWPAALAGTSGGGPITLFDASEFGCQVACEVAWDPSAHLERRELKRMSRTAQFAVVATRLAAADARLTISGDGYRAGVVIANGGGDQQTFYDNAKALVEGRRVSPLAIPTYITNMPAGQVSIDLGLRGPALSANSACASGNHGIGEAAALIRRGVADVMIAGGVESCLNPAAFGSLDATRAMSRRNDDPSSASRPFDVGRDGFVCAEGAGVLILESLTHARERGAPIICELAAYAATTDAHHITDPDPSGRWQRAAMRLCLERGGIADDELDYVNVHGTSTPAGDPVEISGIRGLLGEELAAWVMVSATKSMTGHGIAAAAGFEAVLTALAIRDQIAPPTINLHELDQACVGVDHVFDEPRSARIRAALSNSFGFGGHNAVIAMKQMEAA